MADRTLTARLRVAYDNSGLGKFSKDLRGAAAEGKKTGASVGRNWEELGKKTAQLGSSMTTKLTLPIVGFGVVASKMASDFDGAFVRMTTLAGVSGSAVEGLKSQVLALAEETGRAPIELALALEKLASSGLNTEQAMEALTVSAQASAIGLGDTATIADVVSSAMLAYSQAGLEAAEATDILIATARAGKAEPAELAAQMGKVLPIASQLGVTFDDVGAAIAVLSQGGNDAAVSTTQLSALLSKMLRPSQQAAQALEDVGLSTEAIQTSLREKGLLPTLDLLKSKLGDNGMVNWAEDIEAVRAALALTGGDVNKTIDIFADLDNAAGATEDAFATWADSMGSDQAQAWGKMQAALIAFGDSAAPVITDVLELFGGLAERFSDLSPATQEMVFWLGAALAAMGPLIQVGGNLATVIGKIKAVTTHFGGLKATAGALGAASGPFAVLIGSVIALDEAFDALFPVERANLGELENDLVRFNESGRLAGEAADILGDDFQALRDATKEIFDPSTLDKLGHIGEGITTLGGNIRDEDRTLTEAKNLFEDIDQVLATLAGRSPEAAAELFRTISEEMRDAGASAEDVEGIFDAYNATLTESDTAARVAADGTEQMGADAEEAAAKVEELKGAIDELLGRYLSAGAAARQQQELVLGLGEHFDQMAEKYGGAALSLDAHTMAGIENRNMLDDLFEATGATTQALIDQGASAEAVALQWAEDRAELQALRDKFALAGQDVSTYDQLLGDIDELVATQVTTPGMPQSHARAVNYRQVMNTIPTSRNTSVNATGTTHARGLIGSVADALDRLHDRTVHVNVVLSDPSGVKLGALSGNRAHGGPVGAGRLYRVAEQGRAELLRMGSDTYLIPGSNGYVDPAISGHMTSGASFGGGVTNIYNVDLRGVITPDERKFRNAVVQALNVAQRKTRGVNAA